MALTSEGNEMVMPVQPMYGGGNGMNNGFGGDWAWIILLLLLGWGNGGFGGYGSNLAADGGVIYPWMNQSNQINNGFRDQMLNDNIGSIRDGVHGIQTQLCDGFGTTQMALANGFSGVEQGANARQIANMQTAFTAQTAMNQGFNSVNAQLAQCCCDNRASVADLKYTVATENCADRAAVADGIREVIASQTASTQRILDQLCADKIEQKNDTIAQLRSELMYARGQASQDVQTAALQAGQRLLANEVEQYVAPRAIPAYVVQNPNCCYTQCSGCNCG